MNGFADHGLDEGNFGKDGGFSIKGFDAFPKTKETYLTRTSNGGVWTVFLVAFGLYLVASETHRWFIGDTNHYHAVEKGISHELQINIDVVLGMQCEDVNINVQDAAGDRIMADEKLWKAPTKWSQWRDSRIPYTEEEKRKQSTPGWVREQFEQYRDDEDVHEYFAAMRRQRFFPKTPRLKGKPDSCRVYGHIDGNKVQGDFHITARGHGYYDFGQHLDHKSFNFSHIINELSFGEFYPGINNPLDDTRTITQAHFMKYQYYLSIVPTIYTDNPDDVKQTITPSHLPPSQFYRRVNNDKEVIYTLFPHFHTVFTNQYAVTQQSHEVDEQTTPGIFIKYDIEPIVLMVAEEWGGLLGLVVRLVNVAAGVMVAGGWIVTILEWIKDTTAKKRRTSEAGGLLSPNGEEKRTINL